MQFYIDLEKAVINWTKWATVAENRNIWSKFMQRGEENLCGCPPCKERPQKSRGKCVLAYIQQWAMGKIEGKSCNNIYWTLQLVISFYHQYRRILGTNLAHDLNAVRVLATTRNSPNFFDATDDAKWDVQNYVNILHADIMFQFFKIQNT